MGQLDGRVILLLDAADTADSLVAAGARVYLVQLSAKAVANAVTRIGHNYADGIDAAPSDPTAVDRAVSRATRRFGRVDAVVAGPLWRSIPIDGPFPRLELLGDAAALLDDLGSVLGGPLR